MALLTQSLSVAQWLEHPTDIWEVIGSNPVGDSVFFPLTHPKHVEYFIFHITGVNSLVLIVLGFSTVPCVPFPQ